MEPRIGTTGTFYHPTYRKPFRNSKVVRVGQKYIWIKYSDPIDTPYRNHGVAMVLREDFFKQFQQEN